MRFSVHVTAGMQCYLLEGEADDVLVQLMAFQKEALCRAPLFLNSVQEVSDVANGGDPLSIKHLSNNTCEQPLEIRGLSDFLYGVGHILRRGGAVQPGFDSLVGHAHYWRFVPPFREDILNDEINDLVNEGYFTVEQTNLFYYPNDNMHSMSNETRGLKGEILTPTPGLFELLAC